MTHPDRFLLAGLMGFPVMHSRSPKLHNYWLAQHGLAGTYLPLAIKADGLRAALRALPALGFAGCNLTIPHKEAALGMVDRVDPLARPHRRDELRRRRSRRIARRPEPRRLRLHRKHPRGAAGLARRCRPDRGDRRRRRRPRGAGGTDRPRRPRDPADQSHPGTRPGPGAGIGRPGARAAVGGSRVRARATRQC